MKNSLKALVLVAILAISGIANAQNSASATATANATIVCPISIVNTKNLEFGTITNTATGGTVLVDAYDNVTYTTVSATTGSHAGATPHSAKFTIGGQGGFTYSVTPSITTNFGGAGATLSNLTWDNGSGTQFAVFPCDAENDGDPYNLDGAEDQNCGCVSDFIKVGGKLTLTSAANGAYSALINVAIAYN